MLAQRRRRWANNKTTLGKRLVVAVVAPTGASFIGESGLEWQTAVLPGRESL